MLKQSNFFSHNIDVTWKTFVRESCEPTISTEKEDHCLGFQNDEARKAYDEITNEQSDVTSHPEQKHYKSKIFNNQVITAKQFSSNERTKHNQIATEKVTINAILKAVEQKDLKFLSKYVTWENVNLTDDFGWTPLMSAAYCGHLDVIEFLLNLGANRKARERSGLTAAQLALKKNYLNIVALLKKKSEPNKEPNKTLPETVTNASGTNIDVPLQIRSELVGHLNNCTDIIHKGNDDRKECSNEGTGFYCKICKVNFYQTTWKKHETSTLHIFNSKPKLTNIMYGISKQNKGYQMLLNYGWDEQGGLGPTGKGMKYPIKTCLKSDRKGIGQSNEKEYRALKHIQQVEEKANEILTDRQEIIALDKRRNNDRVGMRALQKQNCEKLWVTIGPLLLKMPSKTAEELLVKDQRECNIEINKLRSNLKIKVNELRDLELNPPVPGLMLQPMSHQEMSVIKQILGQNS
ncbi:G patch domain and ankyrin repeat-containing protein 1 homolog isoform X2 [Bombus pyrosoma]|uniref:G patch domain and ankyrin repeat-containing protein 1 homolog isoform X2 n=1 Tax=Bombus pyrosoma TaxID=396416 RepID=UPI001CB8D906|nr:G patch domain and ankyrin repeat-containing protein 1 homolog isoform X2 [Bombus pyrosoma]